MVFTVTVLFLSAAALLLGTSISADEMPPQQQPQEQQQQQQQQQQVIYLLTLLPYFNPIPALNPSWEGGDDVQPVLELAKDQVNSHPSILPNHTLEFVHDNGGCDIIQQTSLGFVETVFSPARTPFAGIIGPGCSTSTTLLAHITGQPELNMVMVHGAGSLHLANRTQYRNLMGTLGSTQGFIDAYISLVQRARWKRFAILYENTRLYYLNTQRYLLENITESYPGVKLEILAPVSFTYLPVLEIDARLLRVIFIMCPLELTQRIMCLAKNNSLVFPDYQFVIMSHMVDEVARPVAFVYEGISYNCSKEDMESAIEMMLFLNQNLVPMEGQSLFPNITYQEYLDYYSEYRESYNQQKDVTYTSSYTAFSTYFYDAVWAWALVLDNLTKSDPDFRVDTNYEDTNRTEKIIQQFYSISFQGMSGKVTFEETTGFIPRRIDIFQVSNGTDRDLIGFVDTDGNLEMLNTTGYLVNDSFENVTLRVNQGGAVFFSMITTIQMGVVIFLHAVSSVFHKRPSIKASSPKLLHMSYIGMYILLLGIFTHSFFSAARLPIQDKDVVCQIVWSWTLSIGFTLTLLPVAMRTWRIYRIFKHYLNPGPLISDPILIGTVCCVVAVDVAIALAWTLSSPFYLVPFAYPHRDQPAEDTDKVEQRYDCVCNGLNWWTGGLLVYKATILFVFAAFAFLTRRIPNTSFATKSLRVMVYLLAIILPLGFSFYYIIISLRVDDRPGNFSFLTLCIVFNVVAIITVLCLFVPPVLPLLRKHKYPVLRASGNSTSSKVGMI